MNAHRTHRQRVSNQSHYLTHAELTHARLNLAADMVYLVLSDTDALSPPLQTRLQGVTKALDAVLRQVRGRG